MKRLILYTTAVAALILTSCAKAPEAKKFHVAQHKVYHFADGRVGYHDDSMIWYYLIMNQQQSQMASTPTIAGGWSRGTAPDAKDVEAAEAQEQGVVETETGEPVTAVEAEAVAEASPDIADTAPDATGTISAPIEITAQAEGQTEAADTSSADASESSDSGGGGE